MPRFQTRFDICARPVGEGAPCMVVAEIGPNHNGNADAAFALIDAAAASGCDAVKFQYRMADAEIFDRTTRSYYYDESRYDFIRRVQELPHETHRALRRRTAELGMAYLCSVFCEEAVERVADLNPDGFKIPSGEVSNPWLLERVAGLDCPVIASSGMSPLGEIDTMMETLGSHCDRVVLLHCLSEYPTRREDMNLRMIPLLRERHGCPVGLSDHSRNLPEVAASAMLGAAMIEVHFTFDRTASGPDHHVSLLPAEMAGLVSAVRGLETALGQPAKVLGAHAAAMRGSFTNSVVTRRPIAAGDILGRDNLALKKPGTGLGPEHLARIMGRRARRALDADQPIALEDLE